MQRGHQCWQARAGTTLRLPGSIAVARIWRRTRALRPSRIIPLPFGWKPAYAEAFNGRGNAYDDTGAHEQALRDYDEAPAHQPGVRRRVQQPRPRPRCTWRPRLAIEDFDQALRLDPTYHGAWMNRGRARYFEGDFVGATADFAKALGLRPTDAYAVLWLELARDGAGQASQADLRRDAGGFVVTNGRGTFGSGFPRRAGRRGGAGGGAQRGGS